uniref:cytochrome P450 4C1-like n=1 Tax=Ostrinia nubilalis TaxID=29057 RepID=UPI003B75B36C
MFTVLLTIIAIVLFSLHLLFNYNENARLFRKIPGPQGVFIVGNALEYLVTPVELFKHLRKLASKWDRMYKFWAFNIGAINIYTPDDIETIISTTKHNGKSHIYTFLSPWLKDGLLLSNGAKWQQRRKILTPAFHFNILRKFHTSIEENTQRMVETLDKARGKEVDVIPLLSEFTLNSICETAMGTRLTEEISDAGKPYKAAIYELGKLLVQRVTRIYLHANVLFNFSSIGKKQEKCLDTVHSLTRKVIKERKEYVEKNGFDIYETDNDDTVFLNQRRKKTAMLDLMLLAQKEDLIDDDGIQEEVDTFMFEGHDTTAAGLTYCLMMLANNNQIQGKIFEELREVFGASERSATMEDLTKLRYLECCIKESMRLYPPVPFISRTLTENVKLGEYIIPKGTYCHIHIFDLHRREDLYPNPTQFIPDRFLPENCIGRHPFAYIPFSAGPRNCIGQKFAMLEMKSAVSAILRRFQLVPVTRPEDLKLASDLVLRNSEPVYVSFIRRTILHD